jgi:hypothetical protein
MGMFLKRHFPEFRETKPTLPAPTATSVSLQDLRKLTPDQRKAFRMLVAPDTTPPPSDDPSVVDVISDNHEEN